jgi:hypothetical protein
MKRGGQIAEPRSRIDPNIKLLERRSRRSLAHGLPRCLQCRTYSMHRTECGVSRRKKSTTGKNLDYTENLSTGSRMFPLHLEIFHRKDRAFLCKDLQYQKRKARYI